MSIQMGCTHWVPVAYLPWAKSHVMEKEEFAPVLATLSKLLRPTPTPNPSVSWQLMILLLWRGVQLCTSW